MGVRLSIHRKGPFLSPFLKRMKMNKLDELMGCGMSRKEAEKWLELRDLKIAEMENDHEVAVRADLDWQKAKQHFDETYEAYKELLGKPGVNSLLAIVFTFEPLAQRYNGGERTEDLYEEMMGVE